MQEFSYFGCTRILFLYTCTVKCTRIEFLCTLWQKKCTRILFLYILQYKCTRILFLYECSKFTRIVFLTRRVGKNRFLIPCEGKKILTPCEGKKFLPLPLCSRFFQNVKISLKISENSYVQKFIVLLSGGFKMLGFHKIQGNF